MRGGLWAVLLVLITGHLSALLAQDAPSERPRIEGRVVNERDEPIPGADVYWCPREAYFEVQHGTAHVATDADGRFRLDAPEGLRSSDGGGRIGRLWVVAENHGVEVVLAGDFQVQSGVRRKQSVKLSPSAPYKLRVVDPEKRARSGDLVEPIHLVIRDDELRASGLQATFPRPVRERLAGITDDNGEYQVSCLKRGSSSGFRVVSEKYGIQDEAQAEEHGDTPVVTFRLRPTARIEGRTQGENVKAFAGTRLSLLSYQVDDPERNPAEIHHVASRMEVIIGEDGRFEVPAIMAGILQVRCENSGRVDSPLITAPLRLEPGMTASISLAAELTAVFKGQVITEGTNEPVADAIVEISAGGKRNPITVKTNSKGEYTATGFARPSQLRASNSVVSCRESVDLPVPPDSKEVLCPPIKLPQTRRIVGHLLDSAGQPVIDAEIVGLEVAVLHGSGKTSKDGQFEMLTAAERTITDYLVHLNGESRSVTIRNREPLELILNDPAKK